MKPRYLKYSLRLYLYLRTNGFYDDTACATYRQPEVVSIAVQAVWKLAPPAVEKRPHLCRMSHCLTFRRILGSLIVDRSHHA